MVVQEPTSGSPSVRLFLDAEGKQTKEIPLPGPAERITALSLSDEGNRVVLGTESGRVLELDIQEERTRLDRHLQGGAVEHLIIQPGGLLAGAGTTLHVLLGEDQQGVKLEIGELIQQVTTSANGRRVAATGKQGAVCAWHLADDGKTAKPIALGQQEAGQGLSLAFAPDGDVLATGDGNGKVRSWKVPTGEVLPAIAADPTGRIGHVGHRARRQSPAPDRL